jgi:hypothetical protein
MFDKHIYFEAKDSEKDVATKRGSLFPGRWEMHMLK